MNKRYDPLQAIAVQADKMMLCVLWGLQLLSLALVGLHHTWRLALLIGLPAAGIPSALHCTAPVRC